MDVEVCRRYFPAFTSPLSDFANRLLNGDPAKGIQGLIMRTIDQQLDDRTDEALISLFAQHGVNLSSPVPPLLYLPSSYLHASMRTQRGIYHDGVEPYDSFSFLVGTKFANNTALRRFQTSPSSQVACDRVYPTDSTSLERASLLGRCEPGRLLDVCVSGGGESRASCLARGPRACGGCRARPEDYGDLVARWAETVLNGTVDAPWSFACYYEDFESAVRASNSLWKARKRWYADGHEVGYFGHTECRTPLKIQEVGMADVVVVPVKPDPLRNVLQKSACDDFDSELHSKQLIMAAERGYADFPVVWYREERGIRDAERCRGPLFRGIDCEDSWHKEFFAQEFQFPNNACLYRPRGCDEVYHFPPDGDQCSAFTSTGRARIRRLCKAEKNLDAFVAWRDMVVQEMGMEASEPLSTVLDSFYKQHNSTLNAVRKVGRQSVRDGILMDDPIGIDFWNGSLAFMFLGTMVYIFTRRRRPRSSIRTR